MSIEIDAPRDLVFDVIAEPYAERTSRAAQEKVRGLERGQDMVLAAHYTPIRGRLKATTVETVHFERPHRIGFRLVRGPVPYVVETFTLEQDGDRTWLSYTGELGTDLCVSVCDGVTSFRPSGSRSSLPPSALSRPRRNGAVRTDGGTESSR